MPPPPKKIRARLASLVGGYREKQGYERTHVHDARGQMSVWVPALDVLSGKDEADGGPPAL